MNKTIYILEGVTCTYDFDWRITSVGLNKDRIEYIKKLFLEENPNGSTKTRLFVDGEY